ncbi:MAG TPA: hypothetical protein VEH04_00125 [Verrucomicrobiae bacterium]|nr:hypothetical protein [Verrucomicrobiae bacterium]
MNGYAFFATVRVLIFIMAFVGVGLLMCVITIWAEVSRELSYRREFGSDWQARYEDVWGLVSRAHTRIGFAAFGAIAIVCILIWLYRHLKGASSSGGKKASRGRHSEIDHFTRCRRNAVIGVYFGLFGVAAGVVLQLVWLGLFERSDDQQALGIFVFLAGYVSVICGCWWWLKAKAWSEGLIFIAVMPLAILFVPFVRLIFLAAPMLIVFGMIMMPLILIVVILTLPDKSGSRRRRHRSYPREIREREGRGAQKQLEILTLQQSDSPNRAERNQL